MVVVSRDDRDKIAHDFISPDGSKCCNLTRHFMKKRQVDQVNIWYSPHINKWVVCALLVEGQLLRREKEVYSSLEEAMAQAAKRYKSRAQK